MKNKKNSLQKSIKTEKVKPLLMKFVEKTKTYSLSQASTTSCQYAPNIMTPDD